MGATIVHVLVLGSYLSTEFRELWAAPVGRKKYNYYYYNLLFLWILMIRQILSISQIQCGLQMALHFATLF